MVFFFCAIFFFVQHPFILGFFFLLILFNCSLFVARFSAIVGILLFIVYVGGTMVLFTYCLIIHPNHEFKWNKKLVPIGLLAFYWLVWRCKITIRIFDFYMYADLFLIIGIMLFVVIVGVVDLINFSRGSLRVL